MPITIIGIISTMIRPAAIRLCPHMAYILSEAKAVGRRLREQRDVHTSVITEKKWTEQLTGVYNTKRCCNPNAEVC